LSESEQLLAALDETRDAVRAILAKLDPSAVVFPDVGWRVKDLLAHVAAWEDEAARSIEAYRDGRSYRIPNYTSEAVYNQEVYREWATADVATIRAEWETARDRLKAAVAAVGERLDTADLVFPWGARGSVKHLVGDMVGHEREHAEHLRGDG
jgi:hypothetical protein